MRAFKLTHLAFILGSFSLVACTLPKPEKHQDSEASTYTIDSFEGQSSTEEFIQGFSIPGAKTYNYKLCLKDLIRNKPIVSHDFHITETNQDIKTDSSGCLNWSEKVRYNFLAQSHYLQQNRTITANGVHHGSRHLQFAINPWSHGEGTTEALDLSKKTVPFLLNEDSEIKMNLLGLDQSSQKLSRKLWIDPINLTVNSDRLDSHGINLSYQLRGTPQIMLNKINGDKFLYDLNQGTFQAKITLISQQYINGQIERRPLETKELRQIKVSNGQLVLSYVSSLPMTPQIGQLFLAVYLKTENGPQDLNAFEGLYPLGDYKNIKSSSYLRLSSEATQDNFKIDNFLTQKEVVSVANMTNGNTLGFQKAKVEIDHLVFNQVRRGDEDTTSKELVYKVKACLKSSVDQDSLRRLKFKITKFRSSEVDAAEVLDVETDNTSCLYWFEKIKFKYYDCQHYTKGFVMIQNTDLGMNEKVEYLINPWENLSTFAIDTRDIDSNDNFKQYCSNKNSFKGQVLIDSYNYSTLSYNYDIDQSLNLAVHKKIQFRADPKVLMYSDMTNGIMQSEKLRDGPYLLRLVVVHNVDYDSNNTYVTHAEKLINIMNGQINTDIEFISQDLRALGNRNTLLLQILPVDSKKVFVNPNGSLGSKATGAALDSLLIQNSDLNSNIFAGPIILNSSKGNDNLRSTDPSSISQYLVNGTASSLTTTSPVSLNQIIQAGLAQKAKQLQRINASGDVKAYTAKNNLVYMNAKDKNTLPNLNKANLGLLIKSGQLDQQTTKQLCQFWFQGLIKKELLAGTASYIIPVCNQSAAKNGAGFFVTEKHLLVKKLGASQYIQGSRRDLSVGTNFNLSNNFSESFTTSTSATASAGLSFKPLEFISLGVSGSYSMSWSTAETKSTNNSVSINEMQKLTVQENRFKLRLDQYERCVVVRLHPGLFREKNDHWWQSLSQLQMQNYIDPQLTSQQKVEAARRGIMICSGETENRPLEKIEKYYLINQDIADGDMQDGGDQRNRNLFIGLRGESDYQHFVTFIKAKQQIATDAKADNNNDVNTLGEALEKLFNVSPTAPGHMVIP